MGAVRTPALHAGRSWNSARLGTMAELIQSYCRNPGDAELQTRLALALRYTGPLIFCGRAWAPSPETGVWIGPDLAGERRRSAAEPSHFDGELANNFGCQNATAVPVPL